MGVGDHIAGFHCGAGGGVLVEHGVPEHGSEVGDGGGEVASGGGGGLVGGGAVEGGGDLGLFVVVEEHGEEGQRYGEQWFVAGLVEGVECGVYVVWEYCCCRSGCF